MLLKLAEQPPAVDAEPDEQLVRRVRAGEARAGETLVRKHHSALLGYLRRLTGDANAAEELLQQTWLSALDHLEKFDPGTGAGGFKSWLYRIATNKANDLWRSRKRERAAHEGFRMAAEHEAPAADARSAGAEQAEALQRAIEKLPEAQRQVLLLRYYSGMKFVEIAEMLGCPLNTALGRMHKAMLKLKEMLGE